jgi:hypothetical protein
MRWLTIDFSQTLPLVSKALAAKHKVSFHKSALVHCLFIKIYMSLSIDYRAIKIPKNKAAPANAKPN